MFAMLGDGMFVSPTLECWKHVYVCGWCTQHQQQFWGLQMKTWPYDERFLGCVYDLLVRLTHGLLVGCAPWQRHTLVVLSSLQCVWSRVWPLLSVCICYRGILRCYAAAVQCKISAVWSWLWVPVGSCS
jgi:hypothetical protein